MKNRCLHMIQHVRRKKGKKCKLVHWVTFDSKKNKAFSQFGPILQIIGATAFSKEKNRSTYKRNYSIWLWSLFVCLFVYFMLCALPWTQRIIQRNSLMSAYILNWCETSYLYTCVSSLFYLKIKTKHMKTHFSISLSLSLSVCGVCTVFPFLRSQTFPSNFPRFDIEPHHILLLYYSNDIHIRNRFECSAWRSAQSSTARVNEEKRNKIWFNKKEKQIQRAIEEKTEKLLGSSSKIHAHIVQRCSSTWRQYYIHSVLIVSFAMSIYTKVCDVSQFRIIKYR